MSGDTIKPAPTRRGHTPAGAPDSRGRAPAAVTRLSGDYHLNSDDDPQDDPMAANIARLENDLSQEKNERLEERFIYVTIIAFLVDPLIYLAVKHPVVFLLLFLFQLVVLGGLAKRWGVDWAVTGLGWLAHQVTKFLPEKK
jgi:hypothetical protein